jgi:murein DD-endopeptidase MepM/ murein hydrolase activator NlpD
MKTPIDGARLSSSYGVRKHPILGYNKLHKGVDFAAPKGTPIYAAGNGVIDFVGKNGGYGKYIRIRHNSSYKTAYAHLSNYKKNIYKGIRVSQGEVIGYVGSTGKSTGPHLHYEVIYQNKQINPMKMKLPSGKILKDNELKKFNKEMKIIYSDFLFYLYE